MFYTRNNIKIHYEIIGEGKPIFLIHGCACSLKLMTGCMEPIFKSQNRYKRIYIDLPGMGESSANMEIASADGILEVLIDFIQSLTNENFLLAAQSYGGYLARGIITKLSQRIDGVLLICPVVIPNRSERKVPSKNVQILDSEFVNKLSQNERKIFCESAVIANQYTYNRFKNEIAVGLKAAHQAFIGQLKQNYSFTFDVDKIIHEIKFNKPTLLIAGRQDTCVGYQELKEIMEDYPRATFAVVDSAGHGLQIEQPELFECLVHNWLKRVEQI